MNNYDESDWNAAALESQKVFFIFEAVRNARENNNYKILYNKLKSAFMELKKWIKDDHKESLDERLKLVVGSIKVGQPNTEELWEIESELREAWDTSGMRYSFKEKPGGAIRGKSY